MPPKTESTPRHLLGLQGLNAADLRDILARTRALDESPPAPDALRGHVVANLFFEDSTRTRTSFSVAAQRLGAGVVDLLGGASSVNKGETLIDTARNVEAMGVSALVVRAKQSGAAALIARHVHTPVINAGDGKHEHPTQGLLDIYTLAKQFGRTDAFDLKGLTVAIVGDIASSRVARSNIAGLKTLGAKVVCVGPPGLAPAGLATLGAKVVSKIEDAIQNADAVMMLRIQFERHGEAKPTGAPAVAEPSKQAAIASVREYREFYGLSAERAATMKPGAIVMHPGPINRGIELDAAIADGPRSVIMPQVSHGVTVRMTVLLRAILGE
ncbi:MAG: aspartate carbamoyltransferase catalytic subunit [Phycisphaerales bacterium]|jgi:aspartate carbamoyltransferase catalytic subunit